MLGYQFLVLQLRILTWSICFYMRNGTQHVQKRVKTSSCTVFSQRCQNPFDELSVFCRSSLFYRSPSSPCEILFDKQINDCVSVQILEPTWKLRNSRMVLDSFLNLFHIIFCLNFKLWRNEIHRHLLYACNDLLRICISEKNHEWWVNFDYRIAQLPFYIMFASIRFVWLISKLKKEKFSSHLIMTSQSLDEYSIDCRQ